VTLERGVTHDTAFEQWASLAWRLHASSGQEVALASFRKDVVLELYNEAGQLALAYKIYRCWVSEFRAVPELDANASGVLIESITLQNEGWERDESVKEPKEPAKTS
jgi:phage tail-like protein